MRSLKGIAFPSILTALSIACGILFSGPALLQTQEQQEIAADGIKKTVIEMTVAELLQYYPSELSNLEFDLSRNKRDVLLKNGGERVDGFFRNFSNTSSKEQVFLQSLRFDGSVQASLRKEFYYLILPDNEKGGISWKEERTDKKYHPVIQDTIKGFCLTSGYACICIYLHPRHQAGSHFRYLGREISGRRDHVIAFAQKPEFGDYLASYFDVNLSLSTRFLVQGFAWLDPENYQILRMQTRLLAPEKQTYLREQITDLYYGEVRFDGVQQSFWLPREVIVRGKLPGQIFRNRHRYSDYQLFAVESDFKIAAPQIKK